MNLIEKYEILGRVGKVTELGQAIKVSVASQYPYKDDKGNWQDGTKWNTLTIFRESTRKWILSNLQPGDIIHSSGTIGDDSYEKDGATVYTTSLIASELNRIVAKADLKPKD